MYMHCPDGLPCQTIWVVFGPPVLRRCERSKCWRVPRTVSLHCHASHTSTAHAKGIVLRYTNLLTRFPLRHGRLVLLGMKLFVFGIAPAALVLSNFYERTRARMPLHRLQGDPRHQVPVLREFDVAPPLLAQLTLLMEEPPFLWGKLIPTTIAAPLPIV